MIATLTRVIALPFSWWAVVETGELLPVIWIAVASEFVGFLLSIGLIKWRLGVSVRPIANSIGLSLLFLFFVGFYSSFKYFAAPFPISQNTIMIILFALIFAAPFTMKKLRHYVAKRVSS